MSQTKFSILVEIPIALCYGPTFTAVSLVFSLLLLLLLLVLYRLFLHPLSHIPGPVLFRINSFPLYTICYLGVEGRVLRHYHLKYNATVLRVAPNSVSVSSADAIRDIYVLGGGFPKDARYENFNLGPIVSIFSARDTEYRHVRAKAVAPLFAPAILRAAVENSKGVIGCCVGEFVEQLRASKKKSSATRTKIDILDMCARLSIDVVTGYLLGERYGGLAERADVPIDSPEWQTAKLSANPFIFAIVAFSRFSLLPNWLFRLVYAVSSQLSTSEEVVRSFVKLDHFIHGVMETALAVKDKKQEGKGFPLLVGQPRSSLTFDSYPGRLLAAGISPAEAAAQSKAIVFAGADSMAVMLATVLFHLVQFPQYQARLLNEICHNNNSSRALTDNSRDGNNGDRMSSASITQTDAQSLPYLRATIKEGLRLGMANPTRLTRIVPPAGLQVSSPSSTHSTISVPPGTIVGCAAYNLHHDPEIFTPDPFSFRPERWLDDSNEPPGAHLVQNPEEGRKRKMEMEKHLLPFGAGLRACIGKNLAMTQLSEAVKRVVESGVLEGARTCQRQIEMKEWFNGEISGHKLEVEWVEEEKGI